MKYFFYPGCAFATSAGYKESTEAVCRALSVELVEIPDWNCCGATMMLGEDQFRAAALTGRLFAKAEEQGFSEIVTGCNACFTTLKKGAKLLSENEDYKARLNRNLKDEGLSLDGEVKVRHLADVLINDVPAHRWNTAANQSNADLTVAAYYGCQFKRPWDHTISGDRPDILERFFGNLGFTMADHSARTLCCGAAGAVPEKEACLPLISRIVRGVQAKEAGIMVTLCPLCQFNVDSMQKKAGVSPIPVLFFTQLAGIALGLSPKDLGIDKLINPADRALEQFGA